MENTTQAPAGYTPLYKVNLQKDKKAAILINVLALVVTVLMAVGGAFIVPIDKMFDFSQGAGAYFLRWGVLLVGYIVYMILHELIHGIFMKHYSKLPVHYGFTGLYAYAGSDAFFAKKPYIVIALAPVVLLGVVLLVLNFVVDAQWFWVVYLIQIGNIAGAAGDAFVTYKFSKFPADILVQDSGVEMTVYSKA